MKYSADHAIHAAPPSSASRGVSVLLLPKNEAIRLISAPVITAMPLITSVSIPSATALVTNPA